MSFAKEVWETLSKIDVSKHIEKKMNLSYLSWAWAWGELMSRYPESSYKIFEPIMYENGTCEVKVSLAVADGEKVLTREMWLPVMDHRNKAVVNPDSRAVSDARMRCLVKCIAMFGLGHYIYAGEDLPQKELIEPNRNYAGDGSGLQPADTDQLNEMTMHYQNENGFGLWCMYKRLGDEIWGTLMGALSQRFDKGHKQKGVAKLKDLMEQGQDKVEAYTQEMKRFIATDDQVGIAELKELPAEAKKYIAQQLTEEERIILKSQPCN